MEVLEESELLSIGEFQSEVEENGKDKLVIRVDLKTESDVLAWLQGYKDLTNTDFIVKDPMSSKPQRYVFK